MAVVLVVDDEVAIANLLSDVISDEGHRVWWLSTATRHSSAPKKSALTLIIIDYIMPVMDGEQLIEALADRARLKDVPVFLMSSVPEAAVRDKCSGYALFIRKPLGFTTSSDLVAQVVSPAGTVSCEPKR